MTSTGSCPSCGTTTCPSGSVRLWDGAEYCVDCLEATSLQLLTHARNDDTLHETFRYSVLKLAAIDSVALSVAFICFWFILPLMAIFNPNEDLFEAIQMWVFLFLLGVPVAAVFSLVDAVDFALHRLVISVAAGELTVTGRGTSTTVPLSPCEWYLGSISDMNVLEYGFSRRQGYIGFLRAPALIIVLPTAEGMDARKVAVGIDEEMRATWQAFLELARVPQRTDYHAKRSLPIILEMACLGLVFSVAFVASLVTGGLVGNTLALVVPDQSLCQMVGHVMFMDGCFTGIFYAAYYVGIWDANFTPSKRTVRDRTTLVLVAVCLMLGVDAVFIWPLAFDADFSGTARIVAIALSTSWALLVGCDIGRRPRRSEREKSKPVHYKQAK